MLLHVLSLPQLLIRVWRVIRPLPNTRHHGNESELEQPGSWPCAHELEVALDEVGVANLAQLVVM